MSSKETLENLLAMINTKENAKALVELFKQAMERINTLERKLMATMEEKHSESDAQIMDAIRSLDPLKEEFRRAIQEAKEANETTFAQVRQRALEGINNLFNKMRLNEKFNSMMDDMMREHDAKTAELDAKIQSVPSKEDFLALIPKEETAVETRDKLESIQEEAEKLKIAAIGHLQEELDKLKAQMGRVSGGGGTSRIGIQAALAKMIKHKSVSVTTTTTSITLDDKVAGNVAIWLRYQGQLQTYGTHYTVSGTLVSLLFTPDDATYIDATYITG